MSSDAAGPRSNGAARGQGVSDPSMPTATSRRVQGKARLAARRPLEQDGKATMRAESASSVGEKDAASPQDRAMGTPWSRFVGMVSRHRGKFSLGTIVGLVLGLLAWMYP